MSAVAADLRAVSPWRLALPAVLLLQAAILLLYRDTAIAMVGIWMRSDTFAHAVLVPPISLWLIWRQREHLALLTPRAQPWVLVPMLGLALGWLLADLVVVNAATQFALVALLVLAVPAVLGLEVAAAILFPLLFMFFAVPFGEFMIPLMMEWTADFTVFALQASGIPVYREGLSFIIPSGSWSVVQACSGVRYLIASFMVGTLFAYLNYRSSSRRAIFMLVSVLVPIGANWLRAYMIVMLGHLSGNTLAVGVDHLIYGWVFFGVVIFIMFIIGSRWSEVQADAASTGAGVKATAPRHSLQSSWTASGRSVYVAIAAATMLALPPLAVTALERSEGQVSDARLQLPDEFGAGWRVMVPAGLNFTPSFENPSVAAAATYEGPAGQVGTFVAYYRGQREQKKLVPSGYLLVLPGDEAWNHMGTAPVAVTVGGEVVDLLSADLLGRAGAQKPRLMAWRVYWIDGRWVAGDVAAKVANAVARARGRGDDGAVVVVYTDGAQPDQARATLTAFVQQNFGSLNHLLQQTHAARAPGVGSPVKETP